MPQTRHAAADRAAEPRQAAAPKPSEGEPGRPRPAAGTVQVRLGSLRSPEAAREEWQRLKRENADLLGNLRANAVSVDLGEKGIWYRIHGGAAG